MLNQASPHGFVELRDAFRQSFQGLDEAVKLPFADAALPDLRGQLTR